MSRPIKPFKCRDCGESRPHNFDAAYKSLCADCRRYKERMRYWQARGRYLEK